MLGSTGNVTSQMSAFDRIIPIIIEEEGGYVNHPKDPGGETKYGISKRRFPNEDIKNLTKERAKELYYKHYWLEAGLDKLEDELGGTSDKNGGDKLLERILSHSILLGPDRAVRCLQRALRANYETTTEDGKVGPRVRAALGRAVAQNGSYCVLVAFKSECAGVYRILLERNPDNLVFIEGWLNRAYR